MALLDIDDAIYEATEEHGAPTKNAASLWRKCRHCHNKWRVHLVYMGDTTALLVCGHCYTTVRFVKG